VLISSDFTGTLLEILIGIEVFFFCIPLLSKKLFSFELEFWLEFSPRARLATSDDFG